MPVIANIYLSDADSEKCLQQITRAKSAHLRWRAYAQALLAGQEIEEGQLPLEHTECQFGRWYYGAGQALSTLPAFRAIESPHRQLHQISLDLFRLLEHGETPPFWQQLLGFKKKSDAKKTALIQQQATQLTRVSAELLKALDTLEQQLKSAG